VKTIEHEVWINADATTVFRAITPKEGLDAWWGKALTAGAELHHVVQFDHGLGEPLRMRITELNPGHGVTWRCISEFVEPGNPASEWLGHQLRFELEQGPDDCTPQWLQDRLGIQPDDRFTVLRFKHTGWDRGARWFGFCNCGWGVTLDGLKRYCETRDQAGEREP
jgi:uncharacterized protein YndB with AHSA1/START domain